MMEKIELFGLTTIPLIKPGDALPELIVQAVASENLRLLDRDIVIISSKIVAKSEGRVVDLNGVKPSIKARIISKVTGKKVKEVEVMIRECKTVIGEIPLRGAHSKFGNKLPIAGGVSDEQLNSILDDTPSLLVVEMQNGRVCSSSGEDDTNVEGKNMVALLPKDPDDSARRLRKKIYELTGARVAVIISDSEVRVLRQGTTDIAIGVSGINPIRHDFGKPCLFGKPKVGGVDALADLLTASSNILMGQTNEGIPVVIARGVKYEEDDIGSGPLRMTKKVLAWSMYSTALSGLKLRLCNWLALPWRK